jgi:type I restriction enzyme M protein
MTEAAVRSHAAFIWSAADLLRGDHKQSEYGKVVVPLTVIRRLDCMLNPTEQAALDWTAKLVGRVENVQPVLCAVLHPTGKDGRTAGLNPNRSRDDLSRS